MKAINWGINWSEGSTLRGLVWLFGGITSVIVLLVTDSAEKAGFVLATTGTVSGGLGALIKSGVSNERSD